MCRVRDRRSGYQNAPGKQNPLTPGAGSAFKERGAVNRAQFMNKNSNDSAKKLTGFQLLMLVLCIYVLGALLVEVAFKLPPQVSSLLQTLDTVICFIFLADFFHRLYRAENRLAFLKWGWIDFI
jgi:hypothetical protein